MLHICGATWPLCMPGTQSVPHNQNLYVYAYLYPILPGNRRSTADENGPQ